jgi:integrase
VHDLRHTCATLALEAGVHPKVVSERLGHEKIGVTLKLCSHVTEGLEAGASRRLPVAAVLEPEVRQNPTERRLWTAA